MNKQINQYLKFQKLEGEILKTIKLDIRIGEIVFSDQFEWDINNPSNSPEEFAKNLCADVGLGSEFLLPITHSIKEQIIDHQKTCLNERRFYYNMLYNKTNKVKQSNESNETFRDIFTDNSDWQPTLKRISVEEIKKFEKKEERKSRYAQRKK